MVGMDEAGMILIDNKKPVIILPIAVRHMLNLQVFSSIGINVVNHGYSKIAWKITSAVHGC